MKTIEEILKELYDDKAVIDKIKAVAYNEFQSTREREKYEKGFLVCLEWVKAKFK